MKKEEQKKSERIKENVATGAGAMAGGIAGAAVGSTIPFEVTAEDVRTDEFDINGGSKSSLNADHGHRGEAKNVESVEDGQKTDVETEPVVKPEVVDDNTSSDKFSDHDVEVIDYDTKMDECGNLVDVAIVSIDGKGAVLIDDNLDGFADKIAIDENGNGTIDTGESHNVADVFSDPVSMESFRSDFNAVNDNNPYEGPDYVNDADVSDFIA